MVRTSRLGAPWLVGGTLLLALCAVRGATFVSAANTPLGFVDVKRTINEYKKAADYAKSLETFRAELQKPLTELESGMLLDEGQRNDLKTLLAKPQRSAAEEQKLTALQTQNQNNETELRRLEALPNPTAEETRKKTEFINRMNDQNTKAATLNDRLSKQYAAKQQELDNQVRTDIQAAIDSVAADQGVDVVIDKEAVLHGSKEKDITDAVIAKLNK
ncbi:MAG TPA: OmpH family outer membrane protein [Armatimonadota bacterium]|jgi:Skp family chaperone for outer membrane proteins